MALALSVAREFVKLSLSGDEADPLTRFRLHKLLYYAQAWSLVVRESELFADDLEAWRNGPVVGAIHDSLPEVSLGDELRDVPELVGDEAEFVGRVWSAYKRHSASRLSEMTRQEKPWLKAWREGSGKDPISVTDLDDFFDHQAMPAPLAAYAHELRRKEEQARRALADLPPLDEGRLIAAAKSFTPSASHPRPDGG